MLVPSSARAWAVYLAYVSHGIDKTAVAKPEDRRQIVEIECFNKLGELPLKNRQQDTL